VKNFGLIAIFFCICLTPLACGGSDASSQSGKPETTAGNSQAQTEQTEKTQDDSQAQPGNTKTAKLTKPTVQPPSGPPPKEIVIKDLVEGSGPAAKPGDEMTVEYLSVDKAGKTYSSSWKKGAFPYKFKLGPSTFFPGWDKGVAGMRVGGRREVSFPASVTAGAGDLFYVIDLVEIK